MSTLTLGIVVLIVLMVTGIPVAFSFLGAAAAMALNGGYNPAFMVPFGFSRLNSILLLAMPMFILAGAIMEYGGIGEKLVNAGNRFFGRIKGGLAVLTVLACGVFGAISGSSTATLSCIGSIMAPKLAEKNYPEGVVGALLANSAIIGILIPPSTIMVLYGWAGNISVLACFLSTVIPGLITMALMSAVTLFCLRNSDIQVVTKEDLALMREQSRIGPDGKKVPGAIPALVMPFLILGGIYSGLFTPTEAAAVSCVYAIPVGFWIYRELTAKTFWATLVKAGLTSGVILILTFGTNILGRIFIDEKLPTILMDAMLYISESRAVIMIMINVFLIVIGMLMSDVSATLLVTPILVPLIIKLGFDPVHFAAILGVNLGFGNVTPPAAPLLYLSSRVTGTPVRDILWPNNIMLLFVWFPVLVVTVAFPELSLALPRMILNYTPLGL